MNTPASELISAASSPATTTPRSPTGSTCCTISGNAACASLRHGLPLASTSTAKLGHFAALGQAPEQMMPGMMKMNTGSSFRNAAKMLPRRASVSFGAPSARCTMY